MNSLDNILNEWLSEEKTIAIHIQIGDVLIRNAGRLDDFQYTDKSLEVTIGNFELTIDNVQDIKLHDEESDKSIEIIFDKGTIILDLI